MGKNNNMKQLRLHQCQGGYISISQCGKREVRLLGNACIVVYVDWSGLMKLMFKSWSEGPTLSIKLINVS